MRLPWWLKLYWYDYLVSLGFVLIFSAFIIPIPDMNESRPVPSLIIIWFLIASKVIAGFVSIILLLIGLLATGWRIGNDISSNRAPVLIYVVIEIFILFVYVMPELWAIVGRF